MWPRWWSKYEGTLCRSGIDIIRTERLNHHCILLYLPVHLLEITQRGLFVCGGLTTSRETNEAGVSELFPTEKSRFITLTWVSNIIIIIIIIMTAWNSTEAAVQHFPTSPPCVHWKVLHHASYCIFLTKVFLCRTPDLKESPVSTLLYQSEVKP